MAAPPPTLAAALPQPTLFTLAAAPLIIHAPPTMKAAPPQYPSPTMAAPLSITYNGSTSTKNK